MQNLETGRIANSMGRYAAEVVADALETALETKNSNECIYAGTRCVIKTVRQGNKLFGITKKMHERLDAVILALEVTNGEFETYYLSLPDLMKFCTSTGEHSGKGKVFSYYVDEAISVAKQLKPIRIDLSKYCR